MFTNKQNMLKSGAPSDQPCTVFLQWHSMVFTKKIILKVITLWLTVLPHFFKAVCVPFIIPNLSSQVQTYALLDFNVN